jgi:ribosomal protein S21
MGLPFYDEITIERKVQHARMFMEAPEVITHRGGQVYETMIEREKRKEKLLEKRKRKRTPS